MHTYCFSYNFLSLLLNPSIETIDYFGTELLLNYGRSGSRNIKDMLFVGMFAMLPETRLYIEQDMGTEGLLDLNDKLNVYGFQGSLLFRNYWEDILCLSFYKPYVNIAAHSGKSRYKNARYSITNLNKVKNALQSYSAVCRDLSALDAAIKEGTIAPLDKEAILSCIQDMRDYFGETFPLTADSLSAYIADLEENCNGYYIAETGTLQELFARKRRDMLLDSLWEDMKKDKPSFRTTSMIIGMKVYCSANKALTSASAIYAL